MECLIALIIPVLSFGIGLATACLVAYWLDGISTRCFLAIAVSITGAIFLALNLICEYARRVKITFISAGLLPLTTVVTSSEQGYDVIVRRPLTSQAFPDCISFSPPQQKPQPNEKSTLDNPRISSARMRH